MDGKDEGCTLDNFLHVNKGTLDVLYPQLSGLILPEGQIETLWSLVSKHN